MQIVDNTNNAFLKVVVVLNLFLAVCFKILDE